MSYSSVPKPYNHRTPTSLSLSTHRPRRRRRRRRQALHEPPQPLRHRPPTPSPSLGSLPRRRRRSPPTKPGRGRRASPPSRTRSPTPTSWSSGERARSSIGEARRRRAPAPAGADAGGDGGRYGAEDGDARFWGEWDELGMGSLCVNAYSPPIKKPEVSAPYLGVFARALEFALSKVRVKLRTKRAVELEQARRELQRRRKAEVERVRLQREMVERAARAAKKAEERRRRKEARLAEQEQSMRQARRDYQKMALVWANIAQDQTTASLLGYSFFGLFYYFVVYRYKMQKKDFGDRLKIEKAEAEERKKMRELERELAGIGEDGDGGERNPYPKIMKFVRSGGGRGVGDCCSIWRGGRM